ncbi:betacellulin, isoform CRA_a [Rattus norvegicus]|uniref:Betacellulin, isoform CRA_a n=1 Tax=Rattus norvegicus TaxID=10116 RepID=A6KKC8_RAT|nr:betacellulin, isoform CRA_a [Rattus norvegicus]
MVTSSVLIFMSFHYAFGIQRHLSFFFKGQWARVLLLCECFFGNVSLSLNISCLKEHPFLNHGVLFWAPNSTESGCG